MGTGNYSGGTVPDLHGIPSQALRRLSDKKHYLIFYLQTALYKAVQPFFFPAPASRRDKKVGGRNQYNAAYPEGLAAKNQFHGEPR